MTYCAQDAATDVSALSDGEILVASLARCLGLLDARGEPIWTIPSPVLDFRDQTDIMKVSADGKIVDFGYRGSCRGGAAIRSALAYAIESAAERRLDLCSEPRRFGDRRLAEREEPDARRPRASSPTL